MTDAAMDLTPPTKKNGGAKPPKEAKPAKEAKAEKPAKEKKPRGPRTDYGYSTESTIHIVKEKENKYRGQRKAWFDSVVAFDGQTVKAWEESRKAEKDPPRGWLRFFVQDGTVTLSRPAAPAPAQVAEGPAPAVS
jgi:hypothetical protein